MTNSVRGVLTAEIDGKTVELCLAANEWCELEDEFGKTTGDILKDFVAMTEKEDLDMRFIRSMFRAALSYSSPEITHRDAGSIMQRHGIPECATLLGKAIMLSMPEDKGENAGKSKRTAAARKV